MRDRKDEYERGLLSTTDGKPPQSFDAGAPASIREDGQHEQYWVLSGAERAKGFVRPVRQSYRHLTCGSITTMGRALAETYARDPKFYGSTFCVNCGGHFPVGEHGEFTWEENGNFTGDKVGA